MKRLLFLLPLLWCVQSYAAEPTPAPPIIQVPAQVEPYRKIEATLVGGVGIPMWQDIEGTDVSEEANGTVLHIWAPPGTYKLKCVLLDIKSLAPLLFSKTTVRAEFTVGKGPDPEPKPEPKPNPNQKWQVSFMVESKDGAGLPPGQRAILAGLKCRDDLAAKGHRFFQVFDQDQVGPKNVLPDVYVKWWDAWKESKLPLPCVAIAPFAGGTIKVFPLPADSAALDKLLQKGGL